MAFGLGKKSKKKKEEKEESEMSFLEHVEALRWHVVRGLIAVVVIGIAAFLLKDFVFEKIIFGPTKESFPTYQFFCGLSEKLCFYPESIQILTTGLTEQFITHLKVSFWIGIIIGFPYIFYEFWKFIKPGLYEKEVKAARGIVFICSILFTIGVLFGFFVISPFAVTFLSSYSVSENVSNTLTLSSLVSSMTMFTLPAGLIFELPVVIYFLSKIGLVNPSFLKQYRRHAFIIILLVSAIITPPDVVTQLLIGFPLYILYEISIKISKRVQDNKKKEEESS